MPSFLKVHFPLVLALVGSLVAVPATSAYAQKAHSRTHASRRAVRTVRLLSDGHYTNSVGHWVHSPTRTEGNRAPEGATAECRDGTYSFSESHRGACSHHGGVKRWL